MAKTVFDRGVHLAWLLQIQGVPVRWWCGSAPPALGLEWGGLYHTDHQCDIVVGTQRGSIDELGGVADYGAVSVTLTSKGQRATASDPRSVLCRAGRRGASRWTRLLTTMPKSDTGGLTIEVEDDPTGWPQLGALYVLHIGQEALTASGIASGPYRFTGVERSRILSRAQRHVYDPARAQVPLVYSDPVTWRTRRAVLSAAPITGKALGFSDYIEVAKGFIDDLPELTNNGLSVSFNLAPLTALAEGTIGAEDVATLLRGYHYFDGTRASTFAHVQAAPARALFSTTTSAIVNIGAVSVTTSVPQASIWAENADTALADTHPRRLPITIDSETMLPDGTLGADITLASAATDNHASGSPVFNRALWDVKAVTLPAGLYRWPEALQAEVTDGWSPGQVADAGAVEGAWADVAVVQTDEGWEVQAKHNAEHVAQGVRLEWRSNWAAGRTDLFPGQGALRPAHLICHYGWQACEPSEARWYDPRTVGAFGESSIAHEAWTRAMQVEVVAGAGQPPDRFPVRGAPRAFYQTAETQFLADAQVIEPGGMPQPVLVTWSEDGTERQQVTFVGETVAELDGGGNTVGYRFTLGDGWPRRTRSFGDWGTPAQIRPVAAWNKRPAWEILYGLLNSDTGNGYNGGYDNQPGGCNIDDGDLDAESFLAHGQVPIEDVWSPLVKLGETPAQTIATMLRVMGCALVMRRRSGQMLVGLAPVSIETPESVLTLTDADYLVTGRPSSAWINKPVNRVRVSANYALTDDKPGVSIPYVDATGVAEAGGDAGPELKLDLRGYWVDERTDLITQVLPVVDSIRARMGSPRRVYTFQLDRGRALGLALGDVVTLTARDATAYDGEWGIVAAACRVVSIDLDHRSASATIRAVHYDANTAGWAPSMAVDSVTDPDTIEVASNAYCRSADPISGEAQTDADFFAAGDPVYLIPPGDYASRTSGTISAISGTTVTIVGHGASAGWTIRPQPYDSTNARLQGYVHAADAARTLGAAGDRAKDWAG